MIKLHFNKRAADHTGISEIALGINRTKLVKHPILYNFSFSTEQITTVKRSKVFL